jgi:ATP-dependent helicase/nuclease subunit A
MRPQVAANLRAFMQLALTQDAGRYPSLAGFIRELKELVDDADAAPGEGIAAEGEDAVRLLTIHGAKGLEAPIVWLLGGSDHNRGESYAVLAPWLPQDDRPSHFSLYGRMDDRCTFRDQWFTEEATLAERESTNLLYVALTRAEQALIVSGDGNKNAWLSRIAAVWEGAGYHADLPPALPAPAPPPPPYLPRMHAAAIGARILPAKTSQSGAIGELFHACLEHHAPPGTPRDLASLALRLGLDADALRQTESSAKALLAQAEMARFFDPSHYVQARNEMAFINQAGDARRIDRVVEFADEIWVLDYKTGEDDAARDPAELIARHRSQLDEYSQAIGSIWPNKAVRAGLVLRDGRLLTL